MKIIALPVGSETGVTAVIVGCTDKEYEAYMKGDLIHISSHTIPTSFFTEYMAKRNIKADDIAELKHLTAQEKYNFINQWKLLNMLTVSLVRQILFGFNLDYYEFVDAYCSYLKTVSFIADNPNP
ncbi:MAG TPA: hypothetical protein VN026_08505 [Bacteroidia bacterium]|jgi:hypothetical protein|nr:hypothetical protein [Bacteroidia bacterium]